MIPSKAKDFTGPHGGFEGEEEGSLYIPAGWSVKLRDDGGTFFWLDPAPTGRWVYWTLNGPQRIFPNQPPSDGL